MTLGGQTPPAARHNPASPPFFRGFAQPLTDHYYAEVDRLVRLYPAQVACFATDTLSDRMGRQAILDFIGYQGERQVSTDAVHNRSMSASSVVLRGWLRPLFLSSLAAGRRLLPRRLRDWLWRRWLGPVNDWLWE